MFRKRGPTVVDEGLQQINDLQRDIVLGRVQLLEWSGVPAAEVAIERAAAETLAQAVCDQLRAEYATRSRQL